MLGSTTKDSPQKRIETNLPTVPTSPTRQCPSGVKVHGSPAKVPTSPSAPLGEDQHTLKHGSYGAQGGEKGNEYQAVWMTLACLNAVFAPAEGPQLTEIIFEGSREPFDDIEFRKNEGSFTFFQSKHRDKGSSNKITISELLALPSSKAEKKAGNTAFSLAKYFKGMMKIINEGLNIENSKFIICVSANFSNRFKEKPSDKKYKKLDKNTWSEEGILENIALEKVETFFSQINIRDSDPILIVNKATETPRYLRFSDNFIAGNQLTDSQKLLRNLIFNTINKFITQEKNEAWVTPSIQENSNEFISLFLRNLQLWIDQPKLDELKNILKEALIKNFFFGVDTIYQQFYQVIKESSNRQALSLDLAGIVNYLKQARGMVLAKSLKEKAIDYHHKNFFDAILFKSECTLLKRFLTISSANLCIINSENPADLKYLVFSIINQLQRHFPTDSWGIIHAKTKPLYDENLLKGKIDHGIDDIFLTQEYKILVIDEAEILLKTEHGKQQLQALINQSTTKIIFLCNFVTSKLLSQLITKTVEIIDIPHVLLSAEELSSCLTLTPSRYISTYHNHFLPVEPELLKGMPSLQNCLTLPSLLANFFSHLHSEKSADKADIHHFEQFKVPDYLYIPLAVPKPYYDITEIAKIGNYKRICIKDINAADQKLIQTIDSLKNMFVASKKPNNLLIKLDKGDAYLYVKYCPKIHLHAVIIQGYRPSLDEEREKISHSPYFLAKGYLLNNKQESIIDNLDALLVCKPYPYRQLLVADYGTGKSSLLKQLFTLWMERTIHSTYYEWVIPCHLTQLYELIQKKLTLIDILMEQLKQQNLIQSPVPLWMRNSLLYCIEKGGLLITFDKWDELYETQYEYVHAWLSNLPSNLNYIIATRPHAVNKLTIRFHQQIKLNLFTWKNIETYLYTHFHSWENISPAITDQFIEQLLNWLQRGRNEEVNDILARPLHLRLFTESVAQFYIDYCQAVSSETEEQKELQVPWQGGTLYRLKLYQLILIAQFKKYWIEHVEIKPNSPITDPKRINLFTQTHQSYLREIAFEIIFEQKPIRLITSIDEGELLSELYTIGILESTYNEDNKPTFVYRIFSEYFAAQYILNALLRGEHDLISKEVIKLIQTSAANPRFEEVWRILGEMIRYGEPFLNFLGIGQTEDAADRFPYILNDDEVSSYYAFFRQCLNGKQYIPLYEYKITSQTGWYEKDTESETTPIFTATNNSYYQNSNLLSLLLQAKQNKAAASSIVSHLIAQKRLSESWLQLFYTNCVIEGVTEKDIKKDISPSLNNLENKISKSKWQETSWGGYWDVDAFLPSLYYMHPRLYVMGAAYFIHRVLNRKNVYYNSQVPEKAIKIIYNLTVANLDLPSTKLFYMMMLAWLSKPYLIETSPYAFLSPLLNKMMTTCATEDIQLKRLTVKLLYSLAIVFQLKVKISLENNLGCQVIIKTLIPTIEFNYIIAKKTAQLMQAYFLSRKDQINYELPQIKVSTFDGKDLEVNALSFEEEYEDMLTAKFSRLNHA